MIDVTHKACRKGKFSFCDSKPKQTYISNQLGFAFPHGNVFHNEITNFINEKHCALVLAQIINGKSTIKNDALHSITAKTTNKHTDTKKGANYKGQV